MVGHINLEEQVDMDFGHARMRSMWGRILAGLRGDASRRELLSFEDVRRERHADNRFRLGRREVELSKIVGSVGRHREFDRCFLPKRFGNYIKWKRIDRAFYRGEELPPVSLYKIGDAYFVHDGNHRVSVARYQGVEMIDADVTEFFPQRTDDAESNARWNGNLGLRGRAVPEPCGC